MHINKKTTILIRTLSILLSLSLSFQGIAWSQPARMLQNTLQPQTLFTGLGEDDGLMSLVGGYLGFYLNGLENDVRNRNTSRMLDLVDSLLEEMHSSEKFPESLKRMIPENVIAYEEGGAIIIDLGQYKIRYFNPNLPGTEALPGREGKRAVVVEEKVGRYLTRQIFIQKALSESSPVQVKKLKDLSDRQEDSLFELNASSSVSNMWSNDIATMMREEMDMEIVFAEDENGLQAYAIFSVFPQGALLSFFATREDIWDRGNGTRIFSALINNLTERGEKRLKVNVLSNNNRMLTWLDKRLDELKKSKSIVSFTKQSEDDITEFEIVINDGLDEKKFGPALFIDSETGEVRALKEENKEASKISEHEALNEALNELVFEKEETPLEEGDKLFDFIKPLSQDSDIYVVDDDALEVVLSSKGFEGLSEGLVTHAGTFKGKAKNFFLPKSIHWVMTELLRERYMTPDTPTAELMDVWRAHELTHLFKRNKNIDECLSDREQMTAKVLLYLGRAKYWMDNEDIPQALEYIEKVEELNKKIPFMHVLKGEIYKKNAEILKANWKKQLSRGRKLNQDSKQTEIAAERTSAYLSYIQALTHFNSQSGQIILGNDLEEEVFQTLMYVSEGSSYVIEGVFMGQLRGMEKVFKEEEGVSSEEREAGAEFYYFGLLPLVCNYLTKPLSKGKPLNKTETVILEKLLDLINNGKIVHPHKEGGEDIILGYIYYFAGGAYVLKDDTRRAAEYYAGAVSLGVGAIEVYKKLAECHAKLGNFDEAKAARQEMEKKFPGSPMIIEVANFIDKARRLDAEEKEKKEILKREQESLASEAEDLFQRGKYKDCIILIAETGSRRKVLITKELKEFKKSAKSLEKLLIRAEKAINAKNFSEAEHLLREILKANKYDENARGIVAELPAMREAEKESKVSLDFKRDRMHQAGAVIEEANLNIGEGDIKAARENYSLAISIIGELSEDDVDAKRILSEAHQVLEEMKGLPDRVEPEVSDKPTVVKKRRLRRTRETPVKEEPKEEKAPKQEKKVFFTSPAYALLEKTEFQEKIIQAVRRVATGDWRNVSSVKTYNNLFRIKIDDYFRVIFTIIPGGGVFVFHMGVKKDNNFYKKPIFKIFGSGFKKKLFKGAIELKKDKKEKEDTSFGPAMFIRKLKSRLMVAVLSVDPSKMGTKGAVEQLASIDPDSNPKLAKREEAERYVMGEVSSLEGTRASPEKLSEHEALNKACKELVFDRGKNSLKKGDPVYDYVARNDSSINIYILDDKELKEKLTRMGYEDLVGGLVTHAGTGRDLNTGESRSHNLFVPLSVYNMLKYLMRDVYMTPKINGLLTVWRRHELSHLENRGINDSDISKKEKNAAKIILLLSRAKQALDESINLRDKAKEEMLDVVVAYLSAAKSVTGEFSVTSELVGRVSEERKDFENLTEGYVTSVEEIHHQKDQIITDHPLLDKALAGLLRVYGNKREDLAKHLFHELELAEEVVHNFKRDLEIALEFLELVNNPEGYDHAKGNIEEAAKLDPELLTGYKRMIEELGVEGAKKRCTEVLHEKSHGALISKFCAIIPIACRYVSLAIEKGAFLSPGEKEVLEKLKEIATKERIMHPDLDKKADGLVAYIFYLAGEAEMLEGKYAEAFKSFDKAKKLDSSSPEIYARREFSYVKKYNHLAACRKALKNIEEGQKKMGELKVFSDTKRLIEMEESLVREREEAIACFETGDFDKCQALIISMKQRMGKGNIPEDMERMRKNARILFKLQVSIERLLVTKNFDEALKVSDERLKASNLDESAQMAIEKIRERVVALKKEEQKPTNAVNDPYRSIRSEMSVLPARVARLLRAGRKDRAENTLRNALKKLGEISKPDESIENLREQLKAELDKVLGLTKEDLSRPVEKEEPPRKRQPDVSEEAVVYGSKANKEEPLKEEKKIQKEIFLTGAAAGELDRFSDKVEDAIIKELELYAQGESVNIKKIVIAENIWRIAIREDEKLYRMLFALDGNKVYVVTIGEKKNVDFYKHIVARFGKRIDVHTISGACDPLEDIKSAMESVRSIVNKQNTGAKGKQKSKGKKGKRSGKSKGDILDGYKTLMEFFKNRAFTAQEFEEKRSYSYRTVKTELDGMVELGMLKVDKSAVPFSYEMVEKYRNLTPEEYYAVKETLSELPARPIESELKETKKKIDEVLLSFKKPLEINGKAVWTKEAIVNNAERSANWLVEAMIRTSVKAATREKDEKVVLLLDSDLSERGGKRVRGEIKKLMRQIVSVKKNNSELIEFLKNLEIVEGSGKQLLKKKGNVKPENVIVVTTRGNMEHFESLEGKSVIAAMDDTEFPEAAYLPIFEVAILAIGKHLSWNENMLRTHYGNIPNVTSIGNLGEEEYKKLFKSEMKSMVIKLVPNAVEFDTEELVKIMARVRDILSKA